MPTETPRPLRYTRSELYEVYRDIREAEAHFNRLQSQYRLLASTWMLAALAGIGFVMSRPLDLAVPRPLIGAFVALIAAVGTVLLWVMDMRVYQRLLSANFQEGLAMERAFPWLPQVRGRIRAQFAYRLPIMISIYYVAQSALLWTLACLFFFASMSDAGPVFDPMVWVAIPAGCVALALLILWFDWPTRRREKALSDEDRENALRQADVIDVAEPNS